MASVRSGEDALKLEIPLNAQYIRNLILIAHPARSYRALLSVVGARLGRCAADSESRPGGDVRTLFIAKQNGEPIEDLASESIVFSDVSCGWSNSVDRERL
jgi:hypothetical protein